MDVATAEPARKDILKEFGVKTVILAHQSDLGKGLKGLLLPSTLRQGKPPSKTLKPHRTRCVPMLSGQRLTCFG